MPLRVFINHHRSPDEADSDSADAHALHKLKEDIAMFKAEESRLDQLTETIQGLLRKMSEDSDCKQYNLSLNIFFLYHRLAYLTQEDIFKIPLFEHNTLLAMKAPFGSTLEVPDPDDVLPL